MENEEKIGRETLPIDKLKREFVNLLKYLDERDRIDFLTWIGDEFPIVDADSGAIANGEAIMRAIADDIRDKVPMEAVLQSESVVAPNCVEIDPSTSVHVDAFLYDDDAIDDLVESGKFSRNFCRSCGSREVVPLDFISHSASVEQVKFVLTCLLPVTLESQSLPSSKLRFLDVGSRFGPFLFGAAVLSSSFSSIVGVEINSDLCALQRRVLGEFLHPDVSRRVSIVCADVKDCVDIVSDSDVIVLHNVFEYFAPVEDRRSSWDFLMTTVKRSAILVTCPSLEISLSALGLETKTRSWVKDVTPRIGESLHRLLETTVAGFNLDFRRDELEDFHVYRVL